MKNHFLLSLGLLAVPVFAQPDLRKPPKPAAPPISLAEADKVFGGPSLVTLHLKDATPQNLLKEFSRASGVAVRMEYWGGVDERTKTLTIDMENQPYWTALNEVCAKLGVSPQPYGGDSTLMLQPGSYAWGDGVAMSLSPLVSLRLNQISHTHTLKLQSGDAGVIKKTSDDHSMPITGMFLFDPKLHPLPNAMRVTITEAVDDKGVAMAGQRALGYIQMPLMSSLTMPLNWRADMGKKLVRLRGSAKCFVPIKREVWEIPDVLNAKQTSKTVRGPDGDETYTFLGVEKIGSQYRVQLKVARPQALAQPDLQPEAQQLFFLRHNVSRLMKLQDANGRNLMWQGGGGGGDVDTVIAFFGEYQNGTEKSEAPQKLILEIPLEFRELEVPFELKDLPLP